MNITKIKLSNYDNFIQISFFRDYKILSTIMKIKKTIKSIIKKFDLFSQQVTFRYNEQPAYQSVTGGCISIMLIVACIGIFATTLIRTVDKQYINFNLSKHEEQSPSYFATTLDFTFMFAVGLDNIDMNSGNRYFDISLQFRHYYGSVKDKITIPLTPCYREQWSSRGYGDTFDRLNLTRWLCPSEGTNLELQGKFTSVDFKFYKIAVNKCKSSLDLTRPCVNDSVIQSYLNANEAFNFNYYFINTIINPGDDIYLKTYLEDTNYFPFSPTDGVNANLFISSYVIDTDESLWPTEDMQRDQGGIVLDSAQVMNYKIRGTEYMKLFLRKSPIGLSIARSFRKVDDTLSYIGGLFGTILVFFGFVSMYNQLSYEIQISRSAYYFDKNDPFDGDHFNLLTFLVYQVFQFFDRFGIQLPWPRFIRLHRFLEEGKKQLDMRLIIKKILYAEKLGITILDKSKHKALLLSEPFTLDEADQIRKDLNFYKSFRKKFFPHGESAQQNEGILQYDITKNGTNPDQIQKEQGFGHQKIYPMGEESMVVDQTSSQLIHFSKNKRQYPYPIRHQEEFSQVDVEIKECLQKLQQEADQNDEIAIKLLQKIDPRIKKRYLPKNSQRPYNKKLKPIEGHLRISSNLNLENPIKQY